MEKNQLPLQIEFSEWLVNEGFAPKKESAVKYCNYICRAFNNLSILYKDKKLNMVEIIQKSIDEKSDVKFLLLMKTVLNLYSLKDFTDLIKCSDETIVELEFELNAYKRFVYQYIQVQLNKTTKNKSYCKMMSLSKMTKLLFNEKKNGEFIYEIDVNENNEVTDEFAYYFYDNTDSLSGPIIGYFQIQQYDQSKEESRLYYKGDLVFSESQLYFGNNYPVKSVKSNAFAGCTDLTSVTLPTTIKHIGHFAFAGCTNLSRLVCKAKMPPMMQTAEGVSEITASCTLYVPKESIASYKAAKGWADFKNILPIEKETESYN